MSDVFRYPLIVVLTVCFVIGVAQLINDLGWWTIPVLVCLWIAMMGVERIADWIERNTRRKEE